MVIINSSNVIALIKYCILFFYLVRSVCSPKPLTDPSGYLSSHIANTRRCGSPSSPWVISANPGQIIQLELIDFTAPRPTSNIISCRYVYGFILERSLGINQTICAGNRRQVALYTSKTNLIEIQLLKSDKRVEGEFLIEFEGISL